MIKLLYKIRFKLLVWLAKKDTVIINANIDAKQGVSIKNQNPVIRGSTFSNFLVALNIVGSNHGFVYDSTIKNVQGTGIKIDNEMVPLGEQIKRGESDAKS